MRPELDRRQGRSGIYDQPLCQVRPRVCIFQWRVPGSVCVIGHNRIKYSLTDKPSRTWRQIEAGTNSNVNPCRMEETWTMEAAERVLEGMWYLDKLDCVSSFQSACISRKLRVNSLANVANRPRGPALSRWTSDLRTKTSLEDMKSR